MSIDQLRRPSAERQTVSSFPFHRQLRFEPLEDRRLLANVNVTNFSDVVNGNVTSIAALLSNTGGDGISLREAILAANADAAADTIGFILLLPGSIQLTNVGHVGEILISNDLTINGPGGGALTIRGFAGTAALRDGARIFNVDDGNFATFKDVSINGLVLAGGDVNGAGGAIRNASESLTITGCTINGSSAVSGGGLQNNGGQLIVSGCTINGNTVLGNGAGIETLGGSLSVVQSTISGNSTPVGGASGGIHSSSSTVMIDSSTISGNSANYGGGITHSGVGILMTITNSTISGNSARINGGGVSVVQGDLVVRHSTITGNRADSDSNGTGNGGGIFVAYNPSNVTIDHTIVAGNFRSTSTRDDISGAATARYSLVGVNSGVTITDNGGNLIGTGATPINPLLGPLFDNGGPTLTHALLPGSPAIDAGDTALVAGMGLVPMFDQRGDPFVRAFGARIDIGACEAQSLSLVVDTLADESGGNFGVGDRSLREAIEFAHINPGADEIRFSPALTAGGPATIVLTLGELQIKDDVTIDGPGAELLTIDANGDRGFNIDDLDPLNHLNVRISGLTITGGDIIGSGSGIRAVENFTLERSIVTGNRTTDIGGGIFLRADPGITQTIRESILSGNTATYGGGLHCVVNGGTVRLIDSTISGNEAVLDGGGLRPYGFPIDAVGTVVLLRSTISGNHAERSGGGVAAFQAVNIFIRQSTIIGNRADDSGGGVFATPLDVVIQQTTISGNQAIFGGGLFGLFQLISHSTITGNQADGGGIAGYGVLDHSVVAGNLQNDLVRDDVNGVIAARYSLIGDSTRATITNNGGNLIGTGATPINPLLGPLFDNRGPTLTHALLPGSPAIDAGDPNFDPADPDGDSMTDDALPFDQRGEPFVRVFDGDGTGGRGSTSGPLNSFPPMRSTSCSATTTTTASSTARTIPFGEIRSVRPASRPTAAPMAAATAPSGRKITKYGDPTSARRFRKREPGAQPH